MKIRVKTLFTEQAKIKKPFHKINKQFIAKLWDGTNIFLVDGMAVRDNVSVSFIGGGHGYEEGTDTPSEAPRNEIWIEKMENMEDQVFVLVHELVEWLQMKYYKEKYSPSHEISNSMENAVRQMSEFVKAAKKSAR